MAIETQSIPLKPEVLVLGGGIVGISISQALAQAGMHVTLLEKGDHLGGKALELRTFYNRPDPNITLLTRAELKALDGHLGQFRARIEVQDGPEQILSPSVIVVATGYATKRERTKDLYSHRRVVSLSEMEKLLSMTKNFFIHCEGKTVEMVTFLLDQANEDS